MRESSTKWSRASGPHVLESAAQMPSDPSKKQRYLWLFGIQCVDRLRILWMNANDQIVNLVLNEALLGSAIVGQPGVRHNAESCR